MAVKLVRKLLTRRRRSELRQGHDISTPALDLSRYLVDAAPAARADVPGDDSQSTIGQSLHG
jgi:hypothetical protein